jgi:2-polyprenyl-3-methyl-5-hydroxy-6-metoxy-1,4-benzoquinol methylase
MNPQVHLPRVPVLQGRKEVVLSLCRGKRVLHLGCVDAGPFFRERLSRGELMHQQIAAVASDLWGVDIDREGISLLRDRGFSNLVVADACDADRIEALGSRSFDVIVAAEIVEHLQNPGLFLAAVRRLMTPENTQLIVTVPNAFRTVSWLWLMRRVEFVHPDHNYWFSYATSTHLVRQSGLEIQNTYMYSLQPSDLFTTRRRRLGSRRRKPVDISAEGTVLRSMNSVPAARRILHYLGTFPRRALFSTLYCINPFFADGIVIVARVAG